MAAKKNPYADEKQAKLHTKFPSTHFLSNPKNVDHTLLWSTFFRRNFHRCAIDYLGINLHPYQALILYMMGICSMVVIIACRAAAKSFIIALYACIKCILFPKSQVVLGSATRGQSKLIITEKIENELMAMSPVLKAEIEKITNSGQQTEVVFRNKSTITVFTANDNARGLRSTDAVREEFRQIDKGIDDAIISPFQVVRTPIYSTLAEYADVAELIEEPTNIYISSSWFDNGHWMWNLADMTLQQMYRGEPSVLLAFDESITLKHNIRTIKQMIAEKQKQDPLTWMIEFRNLRIRENSSSYFTYKMFTDNQNLSYVFRPRSHEQYRAKQKSTFIKKQPGEIRIISCDAAFVAGSKNDQSVYTCYRALPDIVEYETGNDKTVYRQGYRRQIVYIEPNQLGDTTKQAIRIRQLFEDFDADYIVLDTRNGGVQILYTLGTILYDEERRVEYPPLRCMNNPQYAAAAPKTAPSVIFAVNASSALNNDIAFSFRKALVEHRIALLPNLRDAKEELMEDDDYRQAYYDGNSAVVYDYERPFIETQLLMKESTELIYEKSKSTGVITIYEQGNNRKDRYSSASYGNYFIDQLELDLQKKRRPVEDDNKPLNIPFRAPNVYGRR